jgi:hypothetical protein
MLTVSQPFFSDLQCVHFALAATSLLDRGYHRGKVHLHLSSLHTGGFPRRSQSASLGRQRRHGISRTVVDMSACRGARYVVEVVAAASKRWMVAAARGEFSLFTLGGKKGKEEKGRPVG